MNTLLLFLAALSLHRIWNYEDVAAPVRALFPWKPISCAVCNPFWIALTVAAAGFALGLIPWPVAMVFPFAAYLPIRATVWAYDRIESVPVSAATAALTAEKKCSSCAKKQADLAGVREKAMSFRERVVILTAKLGLDPHTAMMANLLARVPDRQVQVWLSAATPAEVMQDIERVLPQLGRNNVVVRAVTPFSPDSKADQIADEKTVAQLSGEIGMQLMTLGNAKVVAVDAVYDPHLVPLAQAIHQFGQTRAFAWVHVASGAAGWARPTDPAVADIRAKVPANHVLAIPAHHLTDAASFYAVPADSVRALRDGADLEAAVTAAVPLA
jgi:hypothetical protein